MQQRPMNDVFLSSCFVAKNVYITATVRYDKMRCTVINVRLKMLADSLIHSAQNRTSQS